jgi:hypothetical protein
MMLEYMLLTLLCMRAIYAPLLQAPLLQAPLLQPPLLTVCVDVQLQATFHSRNLKLLHTTSPMLPRLSALL